MVFTRVKSVLAAAFVSVGMFRGCICFCVANSKRGPQESLTPCLAVSTVSLDDCVAGPASRRWPSTGMLPRTPRPGAHKEKF